MFKLNDDLIDVAWAVVKSSPPLGALQRFDVAQLVRGINALTSAQLLAENDHGEFASGVARQLFDQLVNMEYLAKQPDRKAAVEKYAAYGLMQAIRQQLAEVEYTEQTGRPVDTSHRDLLRGLLDLNFDEFKGKPKADGSINFNSSWTGKSSRQLASESSNAMRLNQYELLYREWSAEVHAAPATMLDALLGDADAGPDLLLREGAEQTARVLAVTLNLFLDLWNVLPMIPHPPLQQNLAWLGRIQHELGQIVDLPDHPTSRPNS